MNQVRIGEFLKELRKEKGLTQEQLAEQFNVSRRSVSRWETGNNMPDLDTLIDIADFYEVDLRELIEGNRKPEKTEADVKGTLLKVAEYSAAERRAMRKQMITYFAIGSVCLLLAIANSRFGFFATIFGSPTGQYIANTLICIGFAFELLGVLNDSPDAQAAKLHINLIKRDLQSRMKGKQSD